MKLFIVLSLFFAQTVKLVMMDSIFLLYKKLYQTKQYKILYLILYYF